MKYRCPVCGYPDLGHPPRLSKDRGSGEICPSCGFHFGTTDDSKRISYEQWRHDWITQGMPWRSQRFAQPAHWHPHGQIHQAIETSEPVFSLPRPFTRSDHVRLWFAFSPDLRARIDTFLAMLHDLVALATPFGVKYIRTGEPYYYRTTDLGYALIQNAVQNHWVPTIELTTNNSLSGPSIPGHFRIRLGKVDPIAQAAMMNFMLFPGEVADIPEIVALFRAFIERWFQPLAGAAAAISVKGCGTGAEGDLHLTQREREHGALSEWHAVQRYVRGTFWGTALGAEQCARLGGQANVLREAPCEVKRPLGDGVWLQLSEEPPATLAAIVSFAHYLSPLQSWKEAEVHQHSGVADHAASVEDDLRDCEESAVESPIARQSFPVRYLESPTKITMVINIHTSDADVDIGRVLARVVRAWVREGRRGAFSKVPTFAPFTPATYPTVFSRVDGPFVGASVFRWYVYYGAAEIERAYRALLDQLASLEYPRITEIIIGTETLG